MAIALRSDFDGLSVRSAARRSKDGARARCLLALAAIYEGASQREAARLAEMVLQIIGDGAVKFDASGPDGSIDQKALGSPSRLKAARF